MAALCDLGIRESRNDILTMSAIVGTNSAMHSFRSQLANASNSHDLASDSLMIFRIFASVASMVPTISAYTRWNCLATTDVSKSRSTPILTVRCSFQRVFCLEAAELIRNDDVHPNPGPTTKYHCPVCTRNVTSRGVSYKCTRCSGWVHAKCYGILNTAQYRRKSYWTCDTCSAPWSQQSPPPTTTPTLSPAPPTEQISDDSTFNVLQLNANGIGNTLTELGVVLERKMSVAVIQESKLSPKSKNP